MALFLNIFRPVTIENSFSKSLKRINGPGKNYLLVMSGYPMIKNMKEYAVNEYLIQWNLCSVKLRSLCQIK